MNSLVLPIVGMMIPIILVPVILGLKHARYERELEHRERMKALELGRTLPQDESWSSPARVSLTIGAGVPVGVFGCAWLASQAVGFQEVVWLAAGFVGFIAVICGSVLAAMHFAHASTEGRVSDGQAKPETDADAYDFAGSRG